MPLKKCAFVLLTKGSILYISNTNDPYLVNKDIFFKEMLYNKSSFSSADRAK